MKNLIATSALALVALQAGADPRLGTKACVVENARFFDPESGESGLWENGQKSFVLNVYTCKEAQERKIKLSYFDGVVCKQPIALVLAITTSLEGLETGWGDAPGYQPTWVDGKPSSTDFDPIVAEFHSEVSTLANPNRAILRLSPNLKFGFVQIDKTASSDKTYLWTLTGTCADFQ